MNRIVDIEGLEFNKLICIVCGRQIGMREIYSSYESDVVGLLVMCLECVITKTSKGEDDK